MEGLELFEAVRWEVETTLTQHWELVKPLSHIAWLVFMYRFENVIRSVDVNYVM